jgi:hypothetical protein
LRHTLLKYGKVARQGSLEQDFTSATQEPTRDQHQLPLSSATPFPVCRVNGLGHAQVWWADLIPVPWLLRRAGQIPPDRWHEFYRAMTAVMAC